MAKLYALLLFVAVSTNAFAAPLTAFDTSHWKKIELNYDPIALNDDGKILGDNYVGAPPYKDMVSASRRPYIFHNGDVDTVELLPELFSTAGYRTFHTMHVVDMSNNGYILGDYMRTNLSGAAISNELVTWRGIPYYPYIDNMYNPSYFGNPNLVKYNLLAINTSAHVIVTVYNPVTIVTDAFTWDPFNGFTPLPGLNTTDGTYPSNINDNDYIVGLAGHRGTVYNVVWLPNRPPIILGPRVGAFEYPQINNSNEAYWLATNNKIGRWVNGYKSYFDAPEGTFKLTAVNDAGRLGGLSKFSDGTVKGWTLFEGKLDILEPSNTNNSNYVTPEVVKFIWPQNSIQSNTFSQKHLVLTHY